MAVRRKDGPKPGSWLGSEFRERTWPNTGLAGLKKAPGLTPGLAGWEQGIGLQKVQSSEKGKGQTLVWQVESSDEKTGLNPGLAGLEFGEKTGPDPGLEFGF